jgi:hypothetical protein
MPFRQVIELTHASIEVEERNGYLFIVEKGWVRSIEEVHAYTRAMEDVIAKTGIDRAMIDARDDGEPPPEVRKAMWDWLGSDRGFAAVAFVIGSEMGVARVNMTALSRKMAARAFDNVQQATRWLTRSARPGSTIGVPPLPHEASDVDASPAVSEPAPRLPTTPPAGREPPAGQRGFRPPTPGPSDHVLSPSRASDRRTRAPSKPPKGGDAT